MFLINGQKAVLRQFNRDENNDVFDDQNYKDIVIKCCPYDISQGIRYSIYTVPEAKGYYQVSRFADVSEGDQIIFKNQVHTILNVQDNWFFNNGIY